MFSFNFGGMASEPGAGSSSGDVPTDPAKKASKRRRVEEVKDTSAATNLLRRSTRAGVSSAPDPVMESLLKLSVKVSFMDGVVFRIVDEKLAENEITVNAAANNAAKAVAIEPGADLAVDADSQSVAAGPTTTEAPAGEASDVLAASVAGSDLIPDVYEGGMKVWEGTGDLINTVAAHNVAFEGARVLELGCGAGLPGIYAMSCGALVDFSDYNIEVLKFITRPNVRLNPPRTGANKGYSSRFLSGDWGNLVPYLKEQQAVNTELFTQYDVILTSETLYSRDSMAQLYDVVKDTMAKPDGTAYIASKTYYFGVGGGTRDFMAKVEADGDFDATVIFKSSGGVQREVIRLSWLPDAANTGK